MSDKAAREPITDQPLPWQLAILEGTHDYYSELSEHGKLRDNWLSFFRKLPSSNAVDFLNAKQTSLQKQIRENGITYNVYADDQTGGSRPWMLDILPMIIEQPDWHVLSHAVEQRARLLNTMMQDAYGPQRMLKEGGLPTELVYGHPGFLHQMQGVEPPGGVWLHRIAFDFGRSPDGRWWLIGHRTQAPSGLGYALENRVSISRIFKRAFQNLEVQHLASFFRGYIDALQTLSPTKENTRIALLTPGPYNETYFEHAYLARYLGLSLVQGNDLVVRQNKLYLKTVGGLERVDVLIRRTDDQWLDPLELRDDSQLGVPGLLNAIRNQGVIVANMPGTAWLEGPGLHGFMPALCQMYLQEDLLVPSVPSWWCGESPAWAQACEHIQNLVIRPTFPDPRHPHAEPVMGSQLDEFQQKNWIAKIAKHPENFTLQELIPLSRAPVWTPSGLEERPVMIRLFAVTDGKGGYQVMPGGLTRVASERSGGVVSMQKGGSSMDTWIRTNEEVDTTSNLKDRLRAKDLAALRSPVTSRTAEHLFWLGRYTERASLSLRLLSKSLNLIGDDEFITPATLGFLYDVNKGQGLVESLEEGSFYNKADLEKALLERFWIHPSIKTPPQGLASHLSALANVGAPLRERISSGHWKLLSGMPSLLIYTPEAATDIALDRVRLHLMALHGEQSEHMTRDLGWRFLQLGRQIERLTSACECLLSLTAEPGRANSQNLDIAVAMADSTITYRSRYQHRFEWLPALDLLIFDEDLPYSVSRILYKINIVLGHMPGDQQGIRQVFNSVYSDGEFPAGVSLDALQPPFPASTTVTLRNWLNTLLNMSQNLSDFAGAQYFRLAELPDQILQER